MNKDDCDCTTLRAGLNEALDAMNETIALVDMFYASPALFDAFGVSPAEVQQGIAAMAVLKTRLAELRQLALLPPPHGRLN